MHCLPADRPARRTRRRTAFTLIELLVVISIIALLISILLPALRMARAAGRTASCLSQQRQIGLAFRMYHNDFNDMFPKYRELNGTLTDGSDDEFWPLMLIKQDYIDSGFVFKCPDLDSDPGLPDFVRINQRPYDGNAIPQLVHYGYNFTFIGGSFNVPGATDVFRGARLDEIAQPSRTIVLVDATRLGLTNLGFYTAYDQPVYSSGLEVPHGRHNNDTGVNVLWADGHGATVGVTKPLDTWAELTSRLDPDNFWDRR